MDPYVNSRNETALTLQHRLIAASYQCFNTPYRWQSKTFLPIDERGSNIARNSVFDSHLSPVGRQMAIENSVSNEFLSTFFDCTNVFDCRYYYYYYYYYYLVVVVVSF